MLLLWDENSITPPIRFQRTGSSSITVSYAVISLADTLSVWVMSPLLCESCNMNKVKGWSEFPLRSHHRFSFHSWKRHLNMSKLHFNQFKCSFKISVKQLWLGTNVFLNIKITFWLVEIDLQITIILDISNSLFSRNNNKLYLQLHFYMLKKGMLRIKM